MAEAIQSPAAGDILVDPRAHPVLDRQSAGICMLRLHRGQTYDAARCAASAIIRFDRPLLRLGRLLQFWFGQWRHPRYLGRGNLHIFLFAGFIVLVVHTVDCWRWGPRQSPPGDGRPVRRNLRLRRNRRLPLHDRGDRAAAAQARALCGAGAVRQSPHRRRHLPAGADRHADGGATASSRPAMPPANGSSTCRLSLWRCCRWPWMLQGALAAAPVAGRWRNLYLGAYLVHELAFFFLLCYRPFGIQFHVETSLFSCLFREAGPGHGQAGALGRSRRRSSTR